MKQLLTIMAVLFCLQSQAQWRAATDYQSKTKTRGFAKHKYVRGRSIILDTAIYHDTAFSVWVQGTNGCAAYQKTDTSQLVVLDSASTIRSLFFGVKQNRLQFEKLEAENERLRYVIREAAKMLQNLKTDFQKTFDHLINPKNK